MPPSKPPSNDVWPNEFATLQRQQLFANPPKDHTPYPSVAEAFEPHVQSFNRVFEPDGLLAQGIEDIGTKEFLIADTRNASGTSAAGDKFRMRITEWFLNKPSLPPSNKFSFDNRQIYPAECRERHSTYRGRFHIRFQYQVNNDDWIETEKEMGQLPIMLRTNRCHLQDLSPAQMVRSKEESEEFGGYFIIHGVEKVIRMLVLRKRGFPIASKNNSYKNRGGAYSEFAVIFRSVRPDETSQTIYLHYLHDGNVNFRFSWRKLEYLVPVILILKSLVETTDREIFEGIIGSSSSKEAKNRQILVDRVEMLLRSSKTYNLRGRNKARAYLGEKFKGVLGLHQNYDNFAAGSVFLRKIVLPHLGWKKVTYEQDTDKFNMLLFMLKKLYALVEGDCAVDNLDAVSNQEALLPGFLYNMVLKEKLEEWMTAVSLQVREWSRSKDWRPITDSSFKEDFGKRILAKTSSDIGHTLEYFLGTGNTTSPSGMDLQQTNGFSVVAERLSFYRFIAHFRTLHRGSFFTEQRTTSVRKLLPESWGFLCPVHTPDGSPCGLLNHLAHKCKIATTYANDTAVPNAVAELGVSTDAKSFSAEDLAVCLNGKLLGFCTKEQALSVASTLRQWKVDGKHGIPLELEIGYIPFQKGGQYPGIYMYSHPARFYRPVKYLAREKLDYVGPFEQPFMSIACTPQDLHTETTFSHIEFAPTNILSIVANMTPFSDFNQSPRNMYQCQMGKQTMGTPATALRYRTDNKLYRIQTPQTPIARPPLHRTYALESYPSGTNAIVAVISYTGYDMDDAMIINKSSHERGFAFGTIYKTKVLNLEESSSTQGRGRQTMRAVTQLFGFPPGAFIKSDWLSAMTSDGLPRVGRRVEKGDIIAVSHNVQWDASQDTLICRDTRPQLHTYSDEEVAFIEEVRLIGAEDGSMPATCMSVKYRIPRATVIGDKFSSRHGQKGVCSQQWPSVNMPFTESGMVPDVIINPHAFPSRMTIGMFMESLAGKSGSLHGMPQDSTPWQFADRDGATAVEYFGEQLRAAGYNYYGNEPMYSGVTGEELAADIYIGVVYYQRLRHMVNDKYQVRTTGPSDPLTGQPVKGRKKGGGIRIGEMERDALIAHGTAFLLQDRLMNCSDYMKTWVCRQCGSFLTTTPAVAGYGSGRMKKAVGKVPVRCRRCAKKVEPWTAQSETWEDGAGETWTGGDDTTVVAVPGVLRYLDVELAAMGVEMKFKIKP